LACLRRARLPATAVLVSALALASCAPALKAHQLDISLPSAYEAATAMTAPADAAALDQWWRLFGDPQLEGLIDNALAASTDARLVLARLEEARAIRGAALSRFQWQGDLQTTASGQRNEALDGEGQSASTTALGDTTSAALSFDLSWEIDLFGRRAATARAADQDLAAARFLYEGSRAALAADVADGLFSARGLATQLADAETSVRLQQELVGVLRIRADRGLAAEADVARAETDLRQTQAQTAQLAAELQATKRALLVLTGAPRSATADLPIAPVLEDGPAPSATLPGALLQRRPDVREAEARFRAAAARSDIQRLELFPRLTLQPCVGLTAAQGPADYTIATWTLGAGLVLPVLDRPRLLSELGAQNARAEQAAITYERAVQIAFSEADQALLRLEADRRRVALLTVGEARAAQAYAAARERFQRGLEDLTTILDAERTWSAARLSLSSARIDALRRTVTSFRALGGGWAPSDMIKDIHE
jgi:NodT family efflux transporter outer membrane factor (OMF) lipoprotein